MSFSSHEEVEQRLTQDPRPLTEEETIDLYPWMSEISVGAERRLNVELSFRHIKEINNVDKGSALVGWTGISLNIAVLMLTLLAVFIAVKSYHEADQSSKQQQEIFNRQQRTLDLSREALEKSLSRQKEQQDLLERSLGIAGNQLAIIQDQQRKESEQPDIHATLVGLDPLAVNISNSSSTKTAQDVELEAIFYNLSRSQGSSFAFGRGETQICNFIVPSGSCGNHIINFKYDVPTNENELFGYVKVSCINCNRTRIYWAEITFGKSALVGETLPGEYDFRKISQTTIKSFLSRFEARKNLNHISSNDL